MTLQAAGIGDEMTATAVVPVGDAAAQKAAAIERLGPRHARTLADILLDPRALEPPTAVIPHLAYAGRVMALVGQAKDGKTSIMAAAAAALSSRAPFLGERCGTRRRVLWVALEESPGDVARRFVEFGADPDQIHIIDYLPAGFDNDGIPNSLVDLRHDVVALNPALTVIDTLNAYSMATGLIRDPNSSADWNQVMRPLVQLTRHSGTALLLGSHARKSDGRVRDSSAIEGWCDGIVSMVCHSDDPLRRNLTARARWRIPDFSVRLTDAGYELAAGELSLEARIMSHAATSPGLSIAEMAKRVGGRAIDTTNVIKRLVRHGALRNGGNDRQWAIFPAASQITREEVGKRGAISLVRAGSGMEAGGNRAGGATASEPPLPYRGGGSGSADIDTDDFGDPL